MVGNLPHQWFYSAKKEVLGASLVVHPSRNDHRVFLEVFIKDLFVEMTNPKALLLFAVMPAGHKRASSAFVDSPVTPGGMTGLEMAMWPLSMSPLILNKYLNDKKAPTDAA